MAIKASGSRGRYGSAKNARGGNVRTSSIPYRKMRKTGNRDLYGMLGQRLSIGDQLGTGSGTGDNEFGPGGPGGYGGTSWGFTAPSMLPNRPSVGGNQVKPGFGSGGTWGEQGSIGNEFGPGGPGGYEGITQRLPWHGPGGVLDPGIPGMKQPWTDTLAPPPPGFGSGGTAPDPGVPGLVNPGEFGPGGPGGYADQDLGLPDISSSERAARCAGGQIQFCY